MAQYTGMRPEQVNGKDAEQIKGYLVRLDRQMRYLFGNLDEENMSGSFLKKIESGGIGSEIKQEFDSIRMKVSGQDDSISEFKINLNGVSSTVQAQGGKISTLEQTAENLSGRIETAEGNYSALSQTVDGFKSTVVQVKEESAQDASSKAEEALKDAESYTDGKLVEYSTTEETKSLISQSASQITMEVSKTYATQQAVKTEVDSLKQQATDAQSAADAAAQEASTAKSNAEAAGQDAAEAKRAADAAAQAAADAEANAAADASEKAEAAKAAAEAAAAADATAKAAAAEAAAKEAAAADAAQKAAEAKEAANRYTDSQLETVKGELSSEIKQTPSRIQLSVLRTGYFPVFEYINWTNYTAGTFGNKITLSSSGTTTARLITTDPDTLSYARGNTLQGYLSYQIHTAIVGKASASYLRLSFVVIYADGTNTAQHILYENGQKTMAAVCPKTNAALNLAVADKEIRQIYLEVLTNKCSGVIEVGEVWANVAELNGKASTLTLTADGAKISSANIVMRGAVSYEDLSGTGRTIINGSNIVTGNVKASLLDASEISHSYSGWNLATGHIRSGKSAGTRVEIDPGSINWYTDNYLTGVLYSKIGSTYIGANSRYVFVGWFSNGKPRFSWNQSAAETSDFGGIAIEMNAGVCTIHCNASKFEIPGRIECSSLAVSGREI